MRVLPVLLALTAVLPGSAAAKGDGSAAASDAVTLAFTLDHNRMIVEVECLRPDGSIRKARAWLDTGDQSVCLAEPLARELGIDTSALSAPGKRRPIEVAAPVPPIRLAGFSLDVDGIKLNVARGKLASSGIPAEVKLPATVLRNLHVIFDYPEKQLTAARPGVLKPRGEAVPCRVNRETGLFMVDAVMDGRTVPLGVDTGSAGTWVADTLATSWRERHPDWRHATGAAGSANFFGFSFEKRGVLMCLPELGIGPLRARDVAVLGLDRSLFEWYSQKSAAPVLGFIGANVLQCFRLEVDFPNQMTYWEAGPAAEPADLDIAGIGVCPEQDGRYTIAGVVLRDGKPAVEGVQAEDRLLRVDGLECTGSSMGPVVDALRGRPGETRTLVIERDGVPTTVEAKVLRLP